MSKFKVGDRVRDVTLSGPSFATVVEVVRRGSVRVKWDEEDEDGDIYFWPASDFELIEPATPSPVRVKTVKEIAPGVYGRVVVGGFAGGNVGTRATDQLAIDFAPRNSGGVMPIPHHCLTATELREAARIFEQLAEAMEDE